MSAQWEYRVRKLGDTVRIVRVKGLMDTDSFTFRCSMLEAKNWIREYEQANGRAKPIIIGDPYLSESRIVPMIRF